MEPVLLCNNCYYCLRGQTNICPSMSHLGIWQDGSLAELVRAPAARCTRLPDNLSDAEGALVEVLACGVNLVDKGQIQTGDVVVVVGGGPMGQMAALVAGTAGPEKVIMTELSPQRRTVGERMGVDITIAPESQDPVEAVRELTRGRGADVVL